jgi:hypothetical protein
MKEQKEKKSKELILLAQCPSCWSVKVRFPDGSTRYQSSMAKFEKLPRERCISCNNKDK